MRRVVGIEFDDELVQASRSNALAAGVASRVELIHGDLSTNNFTAASVPVLYLGQGAKVDSRGWILRCRKPGACVVSHQLGVGRSGSFSPPMAVASSLAEEREPPWPSSLRGD